jgi:glucose-1-phosphate thymidylyltransferase
MRTAVVLAAGRGSRMRRNDGRSPLDRNQAAAAAHGLKALVPCAGRPFLDWVLAETARAGIEHIVLVVAPESPLVDYDGGSAGVAQLQYVVQLQPRGTAHALLSAESAVEGQPFLVLNSDNLYPAAALADLAAARDTAVLAVSRSGLAANPRSNVDQERIDSWAAIELDTGGRLARLHEKPGAELWQRLPEPVLAGVNAWRFTPEIFDACRLVEPSPRGELELPAAAQHLLERQGATIDIVLTELPILDLSSRRDVAEVERLLHLRESEP